MDLTASKGDEESPCELKCKEEQAAIKSCILSIGAQKDAMESSASTSEEPPPPPECMLPAVAAWTSCCAAANADADVQAEGGNESSS